ncbi:MULTISPECIES: hypothetical protein [Peribacillus]|uniref:hypothetical protein n=1 Tax=Peribacillus TaxID=2675229 RepID=UPI001F4D6D5B|nr:MULTISPECIES: hypothetical protein [unclassified Peribacillus]MCK1982233.1 hypothetical protein [Peribacillus sp. Aquil_B1]MCK2007415.1 hypothetical protein [Peribacillus sp. Aquil_B8]
MLREENEAQAQKEDMERWISFFSLINSHPEADAKARTNFMKLIEPKPKNNPVHNPVPKYETDIELLKQLKAQQEGGK